MLQHRGVLVSIILVLIAQIAFAGPLGTEFTYQGRLEFEDELADGVFDLRFVLYDAASDGTPVGPTVEVDDATVIEGLFTVEIDFGAVFGGSELWLEVSVREGASTGAWGVLTPRQRLLATPYSLHSTQAASAATAASSDDALLLGGQPPAFYLDWTNLVGVPGGLDDGDQDMLASLSCTDGQVVKTASGTWVCAEDGITLPLNASGSSPGSLIDLANADGAALSGTGGTAGVVGTATLAGSAGVEGVGVHTGGHFVPSDASSEAKVGRHGRGVWAQGTEMGATFFDQDGTSEARMAYGNRGMEGYGDDMGAYFKDTDGTGVAKVGVGDRGIEAYGTGMGGLFQDLDNSGIARLAIGARGIEATGGEMGGYFADSGASGYAYVGHQDHGIAAYGDEAGGVFSASDGSGYANVGVSGRGIEGIGTGAGGFFKVTDDSGQTYVAVQGRGIEAYGTYVGGYFEDNDNSGHAYVAVGDHGIEATGSLAGGLFKTPSQSGYTRVGVPDRGIEAYGREMGGYFEDKDQEDSGVAKLGMGNIGIVAEGSESGGFFENSEPSNTWVHLATNNGFGGGLGVKAQGSICGGQFDDSTGSGLCYLAYGDVGVVGYGIDYGGRFEDSDDSGKAWLGRGDWGIEAAGIAAGGYFYDQDGSGYAYVGDGGRGVEAFGNGAGGHFEDLDQGTYANIAINTYSIEGNGTKGFVQNHPYDTKSLIFYAALEGDEVATYTRGSSRLVGGEATVPLGETFKWVTNPDIGLTTYLTPVGDWCDLYVAAQATDSIVVRSRDGSDCTFNYLVFGLRIGFEESSIVQEKEREAYIPSMADHRSLYERRPELRSYNSLERFKTMREAMGETKTLDLSRAHALRDAIVEFDPAVHTIEGAHPENPDIADDPATSRHAAGAMARPAESKRSNEAVAAPSSLAQTPSSSRWGRDLEADSFRSAADTVSTMMPVAEAVEAGDVMTIDPSSPGALRKAYTSADRGVVGVVAHDSGVLLGVTDEGAGSAPVAFSGIVRCKVDATFGAIWPGDLLVSSPTPGHAQRMDSPLPGTVVAKALEQLTEGTGMIRVVVMLR